MKIVLAICLMLLSVTCCIAQLSPVEQRYLDSLQTKWQQAPNDSMKARISFQLTFYWASRDTAKARQYLVQGRRVSRKYPLLEAISYAHEAYLYYNPDPDRSAALFLKADSLLQRFPTKDAYLARSNCWQNYAVIQQRKDNDQAFMEIMLYKAIPLARKSGDSSVLGPELVGLGIAFMNILQYEKAQVYLDQAISVLQGTGVPPARLVTAYNRSGENLLNLHQYDRAKETLDKARAIIAAHPMSEPLSGHYLVEGMYFQVTGQYKASVQSFDKGIASAAGLNKEFSIKELLFQKAKTLCLDKRFEEARQILEPFSLREEVMSMVANRLGVYEGLAEAYAGLGNMAQAYEWQKKYSQCSDSINESELRQRINAMEARYRSAETAREVAVLKAKNERVSLSARNNRLLALLLGSLCLLLLVIAVAAWLYYRSRKQRMMQRMQEVRQQKDIAIANALLEGEERERKRLARDLHDGLGGMLAGVKIHLSGTAGRMEETAEQDNLGQVIEQLDKSIHELRRIARNMMPESLLRFGLETALKELAESLMSEQTRIGLQTFGLQPGIPVNVQMAVYRIVQETLSNAIRHADASRIIVQCSQNGHMLFITIEDNGKGFDPASVRDGMGLMNVRNRVDYLRGTMEITSAAGEGTTINIELHAEQEQ